MFIFVKKSSPRKSERFVYFSLGLAAGVAGEDAGVEAATTGQGAGMAARLAAIDCGVED